MSEAVSNDAAVAASEPSAAPTRRSPILRLMCLITLPVIVLDQVTKLMVRSRMALYQSIAIVPHFLALTYTLNPGAAFSMFTGLPPWFRLAFLVGMNLGAIVVLTVLLARSERVDFNSIAFALIIAGAAGNVIDRGIRAEVIDFIRVHYYGWNYPIFNVADSAITIGVALILITSIFRRDTAS
ncbi:MAG TPA: signal peptidase II [Candidatus Binataceae bacterium]|nr:signal peptidase II [Candidatus Binataceae bacterium]